MSLPPITKQELLCHEHLWLQAKRFEAAIQAAAHMDLVASKLDMFSSAERQSLFGEHEHAQAKDLQVMMQVGPCIRVMRPEPGSRLAREAQAMRRETERLRGDMDALKRAAARSEEVEQDIETIFNISKQEHVP